MATGTVILQCLTGYVGIEACASTEPGSGLYINQLPGISNEVIQAVTDYESETYSQTWLEIEKRAILMFRTKLLAELNQCYQINKMDTVECLACENKELLSLSLWYLLGQLVMDQALMNWQNSRYSTVDRQNVVEIRDYFASQWELELTAAVKGIDVENSDCIQKEDNCVQQNGRIHWRESYM